ncbi:hypothetical protein ACLB1E_23590 [Escherichia coli]
MGFISRRVAIDQGHKLASNVKYLLAVQSGAIALRWHSNWRRPGYKYRQDHKERDEKNSSPPQFVGAGAGTD